MIDVSVVMLTYFHENTVKKAIESVLSQRTQYSYEIIVSDDCSGDHTVDVVREYEKKYPEIVHCYVNEKNIGLSRNNYSARCHCQGRYIAVLDGDDYWIDDDKIEWQVNFLDSHKDYYAVACSVQGRYGDSEKAFAVFPPKKYRNKTIDMDVYVKGGLFGTNGMMMRNAYLTEEGRELFSFVYKASPYIDDATECLLILLNGNVFLSERESVVYRVPFKQKGSHNFNSINSTKKKIIKQIKLYNYLYRNLQEPIDYYYLYKMNLSVGFAEAIRQGKIRDIKKYKKMVPEEYVSRGLIRESMVGAVGVAVDSVKRKIKGIF